MYDKSLQLIKSAINNNKYGHLHKIDIFVGHGLGYKPEFVNSWRSSDSNVLQTLGCHPLNYLLNINEDIKSSLMEDRIGKNLSKYAVKRLTHSTAVVTRNNTCISTTCSWQSPKDNYVHTIFEDAIISYDFQKLIIYSPRDTFDSDGYFVKPPQESFNSPHSGVTQSVQSFLEKAFLSNSSGHLSEFHLSKLTCELIS